MERVRLLAQTDVIFPKPPFNLPNTPQMMPQRLKPLKRQRLTPPNTDKRKPYQSRRYAWDYPAGDDI